MSKSYQGRDLKIVELDGRGNAICRYLDTNQKFTASLSDIVDSEDLAASYEVVEEEDIEEDVPFLVIEDAPVFPGCTGNKEELKKCFTQKIKKFFVKEFNGDLAKELGLSIGKKRIIVMFKIDKTGKVVGVRSRAPHPRLEKEAARVVNLLPKMKPGKQRGKPVKVQYNVPISFRLN